MKTLNKYIRNVLNRWLSQCPRKCNFLITCTSALVLNKADGQPWWSSFFADGAGSCLWWLLQTAMCYELAANNTTTIVTVTLLLCPLKRPCYKRLDFPIQRAKATFYEQLIVNTHPARPQLSNVHRPCPPRCPPINYNFNSTLQLTHTGVSLWSVRLDSQPGGSCRLVPPPQLRFRNLIQLMRTRKGDTGAGTAERGDELGEQTSRNPWAS